MSKLAHVRKALESNPKIKIVGAPEKNYLPERDDSGNWSHTVDFHVAPKTGGVYTAEGLQALMMSLVPGLEPTWKLDFCEGRSHEMTFGTLFFDEEIGTKAVRRKIVLTDEDMFSSDGFVDGKLVIECTNKILRRTWVRLFPNAQIAATALEGENRCVISKS